MQCTLSLVHITPRYGGKISLETSSLEKVTIPTMNHITSQIYLMDFKMNFETWKEIIYSELKINRILCKLQKRKKKWLEIIIMCHLSLKGWFCSGPPTCSVPCFKVHLIQLSPVHVLWCHPLCSFFPQLISSNWREIHYTKSDSNNEIKIILLFLYFPERTNGSWCSSTWGFW